MGLWAEFGRGLGTWFGRPGAGTLVDQAAAATLSERRAAVTSAGANGVTGA